MKQHQFRRLLIWQRAMSFIRKIYTLTSVFPKSEQFGLIDQLRRAAVSISLNIAEGSGCSSNIEFNRFLNISKRSAYEVIAGLEIVYQLGYAEAGRIDPLIQEAEELCAMITGFAKTLK